MRTIHKYVLTSSHNGVQLPTGAQMLTVQMQHGNPTLWALVDTEQPLETRAVAFVGTGHVMPPDCGAYLGTVQMHDGWTVLHAFEVKP